MPDRWGRRPGKALRGASNPPERSGARHRRPAQASGADPGVMPADKGGFWVARRLGNSCGRRHQAALDPARPQTWSVVMPSPALRDRHPAVQPARGTDARQLRDRAPRMGTGAMHRHGGSGTACPPRFTGGRAPSRPGGGVERKGERMRRSARDDDTARPAPQRRRQARPLQPRAVFQTGGKWFRTDSDPRRRGEAAPGFYPAAGRALPTAPRPAGGHGEHEAIRPCGQPGSRARYRPPTIGPQVHTGQAARKVCPVLG